MALTHKKVHIWIGYSGWIFTFGFMLAVCPLLGGTIPALGFPPCTVLRKSKDSFWPINTEFFGAHGSV